MKKFKFGPLQRKWLRLLESGKLRQAKATLHRKGRGTESFCCLGVAECKVVKNKGIETFAIDENNKRMKLIAYGSYKNTEALTLGTARKMKFRDTLGRPTIPYKDYDDANYDSLADMNDKGKSFKKIAAAVRKHPEWYFKAPA
jgi:hypothetical protein